MVNITIDRKNTMKKSIISALTAIAITALTFTASAQSNSAPSTNILGSTQSFLSGAFNYFTSFNPSNGPCLSSNIWRAFVGAEYLQSVNEGAVMAIEGRPFSSLKWMTLGEASTFAGVAGTVAQEEVDLGYSANYIDTEFTFGLAGVDVFNSNVGFGTGPRVGVFAEIKKATSINTFLGLKIEDTWGKGKGQQPPVTVFAGFVF